MYQDTATGKRVELLFCARTTPFICQAGDKSGVVAASQPALDVVLIQTEMAGKVMYHLRDTFFEKFKRAPSSTRDDDDYAIANFRFLLDLAHRPHRITPWESEVLRMHLVLRFEKGEFLLSAPAPATIGIASIVNAIEGEPFLSIKAKAIQSVWLQHRERRDHLLPFAYQYERHASSCARGFTVEERKEMIVIFRDFMLALEQVGLHDHVGMLKMENKHLQELNRMQMKCDKQQQSKEEQKEDEGRIGAGSIAIGAPRCSSYYPECCMHDNVCPLHPYLM
jgi:hypothetical protein